MTGTPKKTGRKVKRCKTASRVLLGALHPGVAERIERIMVVVVIGGQRFNYSTFNALYIVHAARFQA